MRKIGGLLKEAGKVSKLSVGDALEVVGQGEAIGDAREWCAMRGFRLGVRASEWGRMTKAERAHSLIGAYDENERRKADQRVKGLSDLMLCDVGVRAIEIRISYYNSRSWGWCPLCNVDLFMADGSRRGATGRATGRAIGYGYDKMSGAINQAFSDLMPLRRELLISLLANGGKKAMRWQSGEYEMDIRETATPGFFAPHGVFVYRGIPIFSFSNLGEETGREILAWMGFSVKAFTDKDDRYYLYAEKKQGRTA